MLYPNMWAHATTVFAAAITCGYMQKKLLRADMSHALACHAHTADIQAAPRLFHDSVLSCQNVTDAQEDVASTHHLQRQCGLHACPAAVTQPSVAAPGTCCWLASADMRLTGAGQQHQHVTGARALLPAGTACPGLHVVYVLHWLHQGTACMLATPADKHAWLCDVQPTGQSKGHKYKLNRSQASC